MPVNPFTFKHTEAGCIGVHRNALWMCLGLGEMEPYHFYSQILPNYLISFFITSISDDNHLRQCISWILTRDLSLNSPTLGR